MAVMKSTFTALLAAFFLSIAPAGEKDFGASLIFNRRPGVSAIDHYVAAVETSLFLCNMAKIQNTSMAELQRSGKEYSPSEIRDADYDECIRMHKFSLTKLRASVEKELKKPSQRAALKEYSVLAISTLEGIAPLASERVFEYERRNAAEKRALDLQKVRLEAEK